MEEWVSVEVDVSVEDGASVGDDMEKETSVEGSSVEDERSVAKIASIEVAPSEDENEAFVEEGAWVEDKPENEGSVVKEISVEDVCIEAEDEASVEEGTPVEEGASVHNEGSAMKDASVEVVPMEDGDNASIEDEVSVE